MISKKRTRKIRGGAGITRLQRNRGGRNLGLPTANVQIMPTNIATPLQLNMSMTNSAQPIHAININSKTRGSITTANIPTYKRASVTRSLPPQKKYLPIRSRRNKQRGAGANCPSNISETQCQKYKTVECPQGMPARLCPDYKKRQSRLRLPKNLKLNIQLAAHNLERRKMSEENLVAAARNSFRKPKPSGWSGIPEELEERHLINLHEYDPNLNLISTIEYN
jgi:hypothetical protein